VLVLALLLCMAAPVAAHPGRLDAEDCHQAHQDFEYRDGRIVKAGERHCHRLLGDMKLDGQEHLQDKPHDHRNDVERCMESYGERDRLQGEPNETCLGGYP
jgi:hypothetical protein